MVDNQKKFSSLVYFLIGFIYFVVFLITRIPGLSLKVLGVTPILLIPALVCGAMFFKEVFSLAAGFFIGVLLDSVISQGFFNTAVMSVLGLAVGIIASYLINQNVRAAIVLTLLSNVFYFGSRWFFYILLGNEQQKLQYLIEITLPQVLYTTVYAIPFFYLFRFIYKKFSQ